MQEISEEQKIIWGLLACLETGVGSGTLRRLESWLDRSNVCLNDFWRQPQELAPLAGWKEEQVAALVKLQAEWNVEKFAAYLEKRQIKLVYISERQYPVLLRFIPDFAPVLFYRGQIEVLTRVGLAVVGARRVTGYGRAVIEELISGALRPVTIVSGMMNGVDELAHRRALQLGMATAAFLGYGLENVWPQHLAALKDEIVAAGGVLVSEFAPWIAPLPRRFPMRNRLVAGSSVATLVIEAAAKSGSLITANLALDYGREVLSVPGSIFNELSVGTLGLIKRGAIPVTQTEEIVEALLASQPGVVSEDFWAGLELRQAEKTGMTLVRTQPELTDEWQQRVWQQLQGQKLDTEGLCAALDAGQEVIMAVGMLELAGLVERGEDGRWQVVG